MYTRIVRCLKQNLCYTVLHLLQLALCLVPLAQKVLLSRRGLVNFRCPVNVVVGLEVRWRRRPRGDGLPLRVGRPGRWRS